jgi:hypothetical protein
MPHYFLLTLTLVSEGCACDISYLPLLLSPLLGFPDDSFPAAIAIVTMYMSDGVEEIHLKSKKN